MHITQSKGCHFRIWTHKKSCCTTLAIPLGLTLSSHMTDRSQQWTTKYLRPETNSKYVNTCALSYASSVLWLWNVPIHNVYAIMCCCFQLRTIFCQGMKEKNHIKWKSSHGLDQILTSPEGPPALSAHIVCFSHQTDLWNTLRIRQTFKMCSVGGPSEQVCLLNNIWTNGAHMWR